jgi:hypothetical protein
VREALVRRRDTPRYRAAHRSAQGMTRNLNAVGAFRRSPDLACRQGTAFAAYLQPGRDRFGDGPNKDSEYEDHLQYE